MVQVHQRVGRLGAPARDVEIERGTVAPPSFYMRSPLLSGLYQRNDCPPADGAAESCAEVTLVGDDDAEIAFEVPLPQLQAATAPALRDRIRAGLADGTIVKSAQTNQTRLIKRPITWNDEVYLSWPRDGGPFDEGFIDAHVVEPPHELGPVHQFDGHVGDVALMPRTERPVLPPIEEYGRAKPVIPNPDEVIEEELSKVPDESE